MASFEETKNGELSTSRPSSQFTKSSLLFNRSMTVNSSATNNFPKKGYSSTIVDQNAASMKKWYNNTFESAGSSFKGKVKQLRTLFESPKTLNSSSSSNNNNNNNVSHSSSFEQSIQQHIRKLRPVRSFSSTDFYSTVRFPGTEDRVVIYFTSLRGIRRTREDCDAVRMIFRAYKVFVDERDVSMDAAYRKELQGLLGEKNNVSLPQVFIKGRYVDGGVDLIRQWNETGELRKVLQGLPMRERRFVCDACGDMRFLPCSNCSGSRKVFDEDEEVMKRCLECNENGLIRCPRCCL